MGFWVYNSRSTQSSNLRPQVLSVRSDSRIRLGLAHPALNGCRDLGHLTDHQTIKDRACRKTKLIDLSSKLIALSFEMPGKSPFTFLDCLSTYETVTNVGNRNPFSCSNYSCYQNSWQKIFQDSTSMVFALSFRTSWKCLKLQVGVSSQANF